MEKKVAHIEKGLFATKLTGSPQPNAKYSAFPPRHIMFHAKAGLKCTL